jgi:hypothetical protein
VCKLARCTAAHRRLCWQSQSAQRVTAILYHQSLLLRSTSTSTKCSKSITGVAQLGVMIGVVAIAALLVVPSELSGADECCRVQEIALTRGRTGYSPDSNVRSKRANIPENAVTRVRILLGIQPRAGTFAVPGDCHSILKSSCALRC